MPRYYPPNPTSYPQSDLPNNLPDNCSNCHHRFHSKRNTWKEPKFIVLSQHKTFFYLCDNCITAQLHHPYYNRPYTNTSGHELVEVYNGLKIFKFDNASTIVQIEFPTLREARYGITKIKEALQLYIQCPCCKNMVSRLEIHHWFEPPKYTYHTMQTCSDCNQRHLNPQIWDYHPDNKNHRAPSHVLPRWELQVLYVTETDIPLLIHSLKQEYQWPLPKPHPACRNFHYIDPLYWDEIDDKILEEGRDKEEDNLQHLRSITNGN
jgi:hypothetical protein